MFDEQLRHDNRQQAKGKLITGNSDDFDAVLRVFLSVVLLAFSSIALLIHDAA